MADASGTPAPSTSAAFATADLMLRFLGDAARRPEPHVAAQAASGLLAVSLLRAGARLDGPKVQALLHDLGTAGETRGGVLAHSLATLGHCMRHLSARRDADAARRGRPRTAAGEALTRLALTADELLRALPAPVVTAAGSLVVTATSRAPRAATSTPAAAPAYAAHRQPRTPGTTRPDRSRRTSPGAAPS
jgi:hypothetical protein